MTHKVYMIETLTNTHVGSGDTSFGVVDNLIQKDPVMHTPVFHPSSLKGAIKDHMEMCKGKAGGISDSDFKDIFGASEKQPGKVKFYEARLLTLPLRATRNVYYQCTSPEIIHDYLDIIEKIAGITEATGLKTFFTAMKTQFSTDKVDGKPVEFYVFHDVDDLEIEDCDIFKKWPQVVEDSTKDLLKKYLGSDIERIAIFKDDLFNKICEGSLPVIARNAIGVDGQSENLFYEEILPRRSLLWFMLGLDGGSYDSFTSKLIADRIQMGANASIGYGVTHITPIP